MKRGVHVASNEGTHDDELKCAFYIDLFNYVSCAEHKENEEILRCSLLQHLKQWQRLRCYFDQTIASLIGY